MPAQIIQTNNTPFRNVDLDPITLDIVENALRNARDEMDAVLFRTPCRRVSGSSTMPFP